MSEPFLGQIMSVGFNFAPRGWAMCDGQLLPISQNDALFALIGTTYGGDGQTTFALPDLRSRIAIHQGQGPGLSNYALGQAAGVETVTLTSNQMPAHNHLAQATAVTADKATPANNIWAAEASTTTFVYGTGTPDSQMSPSSLSPAGGNQPHDNLMPYLVMTYVIALEGIFPSRN